MVNVIEKHKLKNRYEEIEKKYMIYARSMNGKAHYKKRYSVVYDLLDLDNILWIFNVDEECDLEEMEKKLGFQYLALNMQREIGYVVWLPLKKPNTNKVYMVEPWSNEKCLEYLEKNLYV